MPIHEVHGKWQWGHHGHLYPTKKGAEKQAAAAHAHGFHGDGASPAAAGILFLCGDRILLMKRSPAASDQAGVWAIPGGHIEDGEAPHEAAARETLEETHALVDDDELGLLDPGPFVTYGLQIDDEFDPELNDEHTEAGWFNLDDLPQPLHPGMRRPLAALSDLRRGSTRTGDAASGKFYTVEKIGPRRERTPEGFLLCRDVPIARTGMMLYGPEETPINPDPDGALTKVFRDPEEVFRDKTIASFQGKPVTIDHPDSDVTPDSWRNRAVGVVINPRRGEGNLDDLLLADLLITVEEAIQLIESGKQDEVSCGYDADYESLGPGVGRQRDIIGNHVALVREGRCGPRCAIGDENTTTKRGGETMKLKAGWIDRLRKAKVSDEDIEKIVSEGTHDDEIDGDPENGDVHVHIHQGEAAVPDVPVPDADPDLDPDPNPDAPVRASGEDDDLEDIRNRLSALEEVVGRLASGGGATEDADDPDKENVDPDKTEDDDDPDKVDDAETEKLVEDESAEEIPAEEAKKANDSRYLVGSFRDTVGMAEILSPGIRVPTFDTMAKPGTTAKAICGLRRKALDAAYKDPANAELFTRLLAGRKLDTRRMSCDAVRTTFVSAAAMKSMRNNHVRDSIATGDRPEDLTAKKGITSLAALNDAHAKHYQSH